LNKNILEICLSPDLGGLELFVVDCVEFFDKKADTHLIVDRDKKLDRYINNPNKSYIKRSKFPIFSAFALARYIDRYKIDIIHFHWTKDSILVVLAKVLSKRKPKIIQSRHMNITRFKDDFFHRWIYRNIDTIHAVTISVKEQLIKYIPQEIRPKIEMIYLGTDIKDIKPKPQNEEFTIGIVGRVEEAKGQYLLIEALQYLKDLPIKILIVGSFMNKEYEQILTSKVDKLNLKDKIIFRGFVENIEDEMKKFDISVLATKNETFGLVVIESMAQKIPIIAVNRGGPLEIIDNEIDGILFERDSKELAKKISLLYNDKNLREKIKLNGYKKVRNKFNKRVQLGVLFERVIE